MQLSDEDEEEQEDSDSDSDDDDGDDGYDDSADDCDDNEYEDGHDDDDEEEKEEEENEENDDEEKRIDRSTRQMITAHFEPVKPWHQKQDNSLLSVHVTPPLFVWMNKQPLTPLNRPFDNRFRVSKSFVRLINTDVNRIIPIQHIISHVMLSRINKYHWDAICLQKRLPV